MNGEDYPSPESMMRRTWIFMVLLFVVAGCSNNGENDVFDTIPPEVQQTQPIDGTLEVPLNTELIVTYSEPIKLGKAYHVTVNNQSVNVSVNDNQLIIHATLEAYTDYSVAISSISVLDLANNYAQAYSFTFSTKPDNPVEITSDLAMSNPSDEAVNLYNFLKDNYGGKILSSTMSNVAWNINEAEWVKLQTGKYPAITTFDYIHLPFSPANWIDYSNTSVIEDWWNNNGIVSAGWHWIVPTSEGSTDYTYKPSETTFKASNATVDGTWENEIVKADLEKIAGYLKLLQAKNIPVIWRPLHEAAGNTFEYNGGTAWFWWGASGAEAYKNLWIYMFNYFESQGLNNLIWIWTTQTKDEDFYPGDDYLDVIGRDIYGESNPSSIVAQFNSIQERYPTKMVTLSECGSVANISDQWEAGAKWSYFMPWYDYDRTNDVNSAAFSSTEHQHADASWWIDAFNQSYVITRDQMPSLK